MKYQMCKQFIALNETVELPPGTIVAWSDWDFKKTQFDDAISTIVAGVVIWYLKPLEAQKEGM